MKIDENIYVYKHQTIFEALQKINNNRKQFVLVLSKELTLDGIVTDGDVRRGILAGRKISDYIETIMNNSPIVAKFSETNDQILNKMKKKNVRQCPVLNEKKIVIDIKYSDDVNINYPKKEIEKKENPVIIMAGGLGTRLLPITKEIPKGMIKINGKPILEQLIINLKENGFNKILISVNYKSQMIKEYFRKGSKFGVKISYIEEKKKLGTAGALSLIDEKKYNQSIIVMNCDLITNISFLELLKFHKQACSSATMCVKDYHVKVPFGVVETQKDSIINLIEKPNKSFFVNAGIYVLNPDILKLIPKNTFYNMTDLFHNLIKSNITPKIFPIIEDWTDIGTREDLDNIKKL